ncbi:hypothetical protein Tco_1126282, partial [Tanacetum coccineum]
VCACARFQVTPKVSHLHVVKRIFRYLKGQPKLGLWYPKDSPFNLEAYTDSDYAGASLDRKSTIGGCQFLRSILILWQCKNQTIVANSTTEAEYVAASSYCRQVLWIQNQLLDYGYNFMNTKIFIDNESTICIVKNLVFHSKTKHIEIRHHFIRDSNEKKLIQMIKIHTDQNVADLLTKAFDQIIHKGWLKWNATTAEDGIEVKTGNLKVNAVVHIVLVLLGQKDRPAQTRFERLSKQSNDPPLLRVNTLGNGEDSMKLNELMEIYTKLSERVLALENIKATQDLENTNLKKRVKKLEKKKKSRTPQLKRRLFKVKIESSAEKSFGDYDDATSITTANINITTVEPVITANAPIATAGVSITTDEPSTPPPTTTTFIEDEDLTIAQTLMKMRSVKSKEKSKEKGVSSETATRLTRGVIMKEASETATRPIVPPQQQLDPKDKGKGIMQEPEKPVKVKGKDQIEYDADMAKRLQAELDEEVRLEREREEEASNAALIEEWDTIEARIDADAQLAERLQAEEREHMSVEERARLLMEFIAARKKFFAAKRAEEQRNKPPTKAKQRKKLCTYMKHMERYKDKDFKDTKSSRKKEVSKKRAGERPSKESAKRQKIEDDVEKAELKACLEIVPGDDSAVNIESLATKYLIVDWKTHILAEDKMYYKIIKADGSTKYYKIFSVMLDDFDRQDVLDLYRLIKERFESTSLEGYDRLLWGDLITLFESSEKGEI